MHNRQFGAATGGPPACGDNGGRQADLGRDDGVATKMAQIYVRVRHVQVRGVIRANGGLDDVVVDILVDK